MTAAKIPPKTFCFNELKKRCPAKQIPNFYRLLAKHKEYQSRLEKLKEGLPHIDWDYYKRNVRAESVSMVEEFEKKYNNFVVPYPEDKYTQQIDDLKSVVEQELAEFKKLSNQRIAAYEEEIIRIRSMMPYTEMTWDDFCDNYPDEAPDFINKPTFWPHTPEEQIEYKEGMNELKVEGVNKGNKS